jgi:circadian clock protein KaiB
MKKIVLRLYVTGTTPRSVKAIADLKSIWEGELEKRVDLQIIDVLESPQLAEDEKIIATPTLIKEIPLPLRRLIGDLSDKEKVLLGLEIVEAIESNKDTKTTA